MKVRILLLIFCLINLPGCALLFPTKVRPSSLYTIDTVPHVSTKKIQRPIDILVSYPETTAVYNTQQMAYTVKPHQIAYFALNRWAERPAKMLQPLLVQTLQNTHHFRNVAASPSGAHYDYILNTYILKLHQDFTFPESREDFSLRAQLIQATTGTIIATKQFTAVVVAPEDTPYGGVIAANSAVATVLKRVALFCQINS